MKKTKLFLLAAVAGFTFLQAQQAPGIEWAKTYGGSGDETATSVQTTSDGGYIVVGYTKSTDGDLAGTTAYGNNDYWIVKLSSAGAVQWQKRYGGSGDDFAQSVQQTSDGGYIVAGTTYSSDGTVAGPNLSPNANPTKRGKGDYWVLKLNSAGDITWHSVLGGTDPDQAYSVQQTKDGGYIVAGMSNSVDGNVSGHVGNTSFDYWIVKLNNLGILQWEKSLGGSDADQPYSIKEVTADHYIIAGFSSSNTGDLSGDTHYGFEDYWVVKLWDNKATDTRDIEWQQTYGGSGQDQAWAITPTADGGYLVAGQSASNDGEVTGNHEDPFFGGPGTDYWIIKITPSGNLTIPESGVNPWEKSLGGEATDIARSAIEASDGTYIIAGQSSSIDGDVTDHHGDDSTSDFWIVRLGQQGSILWSKSLGGTGDDLAYSIAETSDHGFVVAGSTNSANDGDVTGYKGGTDFWVVKLAAGSLAANDVTSPSVDLAIGPNPTSDLLYIQAGQSLMGSSVKVLDMNGHLLQQIKLNRTRETINIGGYPTGLYLLQFTTSDGKQFSKKVIKR